MLVKDLMNQPVRTCHPTTTAGEAAKAMVATGVGCLPVVDAHRRLVGIVTDRDVCVLVSRHRDPWDVPVCDIMAGDVISCRASDHLDVALVAMKENGLRRIPAVDAHTHVLGIVSIEDVIRRTGAGRGVIAGEAVLDVLRHICDREAPAIPL